VKKALLMVEGTNDEYQIRCAFKGFEGGDRVKCLITEGTKVNNRILAEIEHYRRQGYDPYILSDPDEAGEHLAEMIQYWCPDIPRIEVDPKECAYFTGKKYKAGIEYSSHTYLKKIICPLIGVDYKPKEYPICWD
jgi:5S rRNA maturation endonuclease (ribonuclease M5)